jgi:hypothetical protein
MREGLVREVAAVPVGEDRVVRCVEEQCACKVASAYPRSAPCVRDIGVFAVLREGASDAVAFGPDMRPHQSATPR